MSTKVADEYAAIKLALDKLVREKFMTAEQLQAETQKTEWKGAAADYYQANKAAP